MQRLRTLMVDRQLLTRAVGWAALQWFADAASLWLFLAALGVSASPEGRLIAFGLANVATSNSVHPWRAGRVRGRADDEPRRLRCPRAEAIIGVLAYRVFEFWLRIPIGAAAYPSARASDLTALLTPVGAVDDEYATVLSGAEHPADWARHRGIKITGGRSRPAHGGRKGVTDVAS